jgi:crotonobetainyl-CoA:carnitine CoA-transferase CaiB-like acyl-CoA transferase
MTTNGDIPGGGPLTLEGIKVVDAASLFAGPVIATLLGDHGADVTKIEHPRGDNLRTLGWSKDGVSLWWALAARNKRSLTANLSDPRGAEIARRLVADADVFIENFRPGTLERWGLGPDVLLELNPGLVMVRLTAFGQTGPYANRPGFGTLAESMSGYAHINGYPDGPPTLPPFALGDSVAALTGAFAVMMATAAARSSTSRSTSRSSGSSARRHRSTTSSARFRAARATAPPSPRRATPTRPPTAAGSACLAVRSPSPSE